MHRWEYQKLDLNDLPRKADDIDILNDTGKNGWELVAITANNLAILKRQIPGPPPTKTARRATMSTVIAK
jgi:hypothetical protein